MRTVITFTITDVFDLTPDESFWLSYQINSLLEPFESITPIVIPTAVSHELTTRQYSTYLSDRTNGGYAPRSEDVEETNLTDWTEVFMEMLCSAYPCMAPMQEAAIRGKMTGLLMELGVGIEKSPRGALYLPNAVRHALARKSDNF
ncbi:MAG: hypothetical protein H9W81_17420 [Enterococcus sp.]|nr:hypothetical protein [Enterococcus sp.]